MILERVQYENDISTIHVHVQYVHYVQVKCEVRPSYTPTGVRGPPESTSYYMGFKVCIVTCAVHELYVTLAFPATHYSKPP